MAVNLKAPDKLLPVSGVTLSTAAAPVRYKDRDDMVLLSLATGTQLVAVFTQNAFCAAPVTIARQHVATCTELRALLINSGNANAGTGDPGISDAQACCQAVAQALDCRPEQVLPFSTGVIGERLPVERMVAKVPGLVKTLDDNNWLATARAIMTTDTLPKGVSTTLEIQDKSVTVTGICKGSGMIRPDMATMLAFVATDAVVSHQALQNLLRRAVDVSFNCVTVDGDTSTNDACVLMATGQAGHDCLDENHPDWDVFEKAIVSVCTELAQAIIRDGEGATRFVTIHVDSALDFAEARKVGMTVAESPLVKTAWFAGDANWGRMLAAVGRAGLTDFDLSRVDIALGDLPLIIGGQPAPNYNEAAATQIMSHDEFEVRISLGRGDAQAQVWSCDLSHEYIRINAEYRS